MRIPDAPTPRGDQPSRLLNRRILVVSLSEIAFATALWQLLRDSTSLSAWTIWWLALAAIVLTRVALGQSYARTPRRDESWRRQFLAVAVADGAVWGCAGTLLYPVGDPVLGLVVLASLGFVAAAGTATLALNAPSSVAFSALVLGPTAIFQAAQATPVAAFMAFALTLLLLLLWHECGATERHLQTLLRRHVAVDRIARDRAQALEQARRHSEAKSQFVAHMSHEVRTPLHGMLGLARLLRQTPLDPQQQRWLDMMERSGNHLCTLVNDVLDLSRMQSGRLPLRSTAFDLHELIRDVLTLHQASARLQGLVLQGDIDLPQAAPVRGDATRVRQVIDNLVGNALKFTDHGQVTVRVFREGVAGLVVEVQDEGIGLSAQDIERIFEPFQQADGPTGRRHGGTGLGLTISRAIARSMGGDVTCRSELGLGSTFRFTAQLPPVPLDALRGAESGVGHGAASARDVRHAARSRALVAEDNSVNAMLVEASLQAAGWRVDLATDGEQAVAMWQDTDYDLVLMDCQMPNMDGLEATRRIRALEQAEDRRPATIIALTAHAAEEHWGQCREAGMDDCLSKPFRAEQLSDLVHRHLGLRTAGGDTAG